MCDTSLTGEMSPQLKEQASDSISVLEGALQLKKDFYVHTLRTLDLLAADAAANGETESSTAGLRISADELHCQVGGWYRLQQTNMEVAVFHLVSVSGLILFQVHYDVGGIFFQQGCTDQAAFQKARNHFRQTKELLKKVFVTETTCRKLQRCCFCDQCAELSPGFLCSWTRLSTFIWMRNGWRVTGTPAKL